MHIKSISGLSKEERKQLIDRIVAISDKKFSEAGRGDFSKEKIVGVLLNCLEEILICDEINLESQKHKNPNHPRGVGFNEGIDCAISVLKTV